MSSLSSPFINHHQLHPAVCKSLEVLQRAENVLKKYSYENWDQQNQKYTANNNQFKETNKWKWKSIEKLRLYLISSGVYEEMDTEKESSHSLTMLRRIRELANSNKLCDVILIVNETKIPAHKLILSAASDYFAAMFTGNLQEANAYEVIMEQMNEEALQLLINYIYTGFIDIRQDNVEVLLSTSSMLQLDQVQEMCSSFLVKQLHISNCLGIRSFALTYASHFLYDISNQFVLDHFRQLVDQTEFLAMTYDQLLSLLSSDYLNVADEEEAFNAMMSWIEYDLEDRKQYLVRLFKQIRLPLLSVTFLADTVENHVLLKDVNECTKFIVEALKYHALPDRRQQISINNKRTLPRKSTIGYLYAIGGDSPNQTIERYNPRTNSWSIVASTPSNKTQFAAVSIDSTLYIIGGRDRLKTLSDFQCYDFKEKTWTDNMPMSTPRHALSVIALDSSTIYAIGGHDGWSYLNTVERWDKSSKSWNFVSSMMHARGSSGVATVNNKMYIIGGKDGSSCLRFVECYDPNTNRWKACSSMSETRCSVGVTVLNQYIYAVGGHLISSSDHSVVYLDLVESYDIKSDNWTVLNPLSSPRDAVGISLLHNHIYIAGGYDGQFLDTVEYLNQEFSWKKAASLVNRRASPILIHSKF